MAGERFRHRSATGRPAVIPRVSLRIVPVALLLWAIASPGRGATLESACGDLPLPELPVILKPVPLAVTRPDFPLPEPPAPSRQSVYGQAPLPAFATAVVKPLPAVRDPGAFSCAFMTFRSAEGLADCGVHRALQGDLLGARRSLEQSVALEPRGAHAPTAALWLGEIALREGRAEEAAHSYRAALARESKDTVAFDAVLGLAWLMLQAGDPAGALQTLGRASRPPGASSEAHLAGFVEGVALLLAGKPSQALAELEAVAADRLPEAMSQELTFWRGVALARLGERDRAIAALDRFLSGVPSTHPLRADAVIQTGWIALERGAAGDAVRRFALAERASPRAGVRPQIQAGLVRAYLALGDTARAAEMARRLVAESSGHALVAPTLLALADAMESGATADGTAIYREVLALSAAPALEDYARYRLGERLEQGRRFDEARREFLRLRDHGRDEGLAQRAAYRLGLQGLRANEPAAARREGEALLRAGTVAELREIALLLAAEGAAREGDANRALALFRATLGEFPDSPRAARIRLALGWGHLHDGDALLALQEWRQALQVADPETRNLAALAIAGVTLRERPETEALDALRAVSGISAPASLVESAALDHGILATRAGAWDEAVRVLEPLAPRLAEASRQALARQALGIARYRLGQYDLAERHLQQAIQLAPAEPSGWLGIGLIALRQDRLLDAQDAFERARDRGGQETAAPAAYGLVLVAGRRGDEAAFRERAAAFVEAHAGHDAAPPLLCALTAAAIARGEAPNAAEWVKRLVRDHSRSQYAREALGRLAAATEGQPELRRRAYEETLAHPVTDELRLEAWLGLADAAFATGDAAAAQRGVEAFLREAPGADPRIPAAFSRLVRIHEAEGRRGLAVRAADAFLARFPTDSLVPFVELIRGRLLVAEAQWGPAWRSLETARIRGVPTVAAEAHFWLGETLRLRGHHEAAIAVYLGASVLHPDTTWAARGLQGAAQSYLARNMPRDAAMLLRQLTEQPNAEPALVRWAQEALTHIEAKPPIQSRRDAPGPAKPRRGAR